MPRDELNRRWKCLDDAILERARTWSKPVIKELASMTRPEQLRCVAEFDMREFSSIDGAVLGEDSKEQDVQAKSCSMTPAMSALLERSYEHIAKLKECAEGIDCFYKREAIRYQLSRIEGALEAWSKTPKEMLNVQAE